MRNSFVLILSTLLLALTSCQAHTNEHPVQAGTNIVTVVGAIHGGHRSSERYSLEILRQAILEFKPDVILVELPEDRYLKASANFDQFGEVRESRTDDFPELTDVIFPLRRELGFTIIPVAAWTPKIAADRRAVLGRLENDPARTEDWNSYQAAIRAFNRSVSGKSDDPKFVHSDGYDNAVRSRQETYERLFGADLGDGGWTQINQSHLTLINEALDDLKGQDKRILILFGAWHKYKILRALEARSDVSILDAATLF